MLDLLHFEGFYFLLVIVIGYLLQGLHPLVPLLLRLSFEGQLLGHRLDLEASLRLIVHFNVGLAQINFVKMLDFVRF